eukprot:gnl/TRDRNA2_/TRDRNA2_158022_c0_seq2.p1 gnl/TRDRNA2_/TRDRNA2_158022_c0~~gnl/TRDRNA2_/TRDRNA2_158022_c0_seq2.p1  ORF type:complete len:516 (+),score=91.24 gnl/TRDRNA2_/TRDRNA2_158022_c0_seq2:213-1550(+)
MVTDEAGETLCSLCLESEAGDNCELCAKNFHKVQGVCTPCGPHQDGDECELCAEGHGRGADGVCAECDMLYRSPSGQDGPCEVDPLAVLLLAGIIVVLICPVCCAGSIWMRRKKKQRKQAKVEELLESWKQSMWDQDAQGEAHISETLKKYGWSAEMIDNERKQILQEQSNQAGVSVAYLFSDEFEQLATTRTDKPDPTFADMKPTFWYDGPDAIGRNTTCPRDGKAGCALVDTLASRYRKPCNYFLSWSWRYSLSQLRSGLKTWLKAKKLEPHEVFLWMCFFANNQFRIIVQGTSTVSDELEGMFQANLTRIGRMVALLDNWESSIYLSRIWTIYEQFMATKLEIQIDFALPEEPTKSLVKLIKSGEEGINRIGRSLCDVNSEHAEASVKEDEEHVKKVIKKSIGFNKVNTSVQNSMSTWIGHTVQQTMKTTVEEMTQNVSSQQ